MSEELISCSACHKDLAMRFIEVKDLVFCSNYCLENFMAEMGQKKFNRLYSDHFVPGESKGWVPKYANDYMQMCVPCKKSLSERCFDELKIGAVYHDVLEETEGHRWCCHARFCLSCALSDGTVSLEAGRAVQQYAEKKAKELDMRGVTTIIISQSLADMAQCFTYEQLPENIPEIEPPEVSHIAACLLCDEAFGRQCEAQVEREFSMVEKVKPLIDKLWCSHAIHALADMLIDRADGEQLLKKIIPFADSVAREKGAPGVTTRTLFVALGRML